MRRLKFEMSFGLVALGCLVATAALGWAAKPSTSVDPIRAQAYELVDATGRVRGRWGIENDTASFALFDAGGNVKIKLEVLDQPRVILFGDKGNHAVKIVYDPENGTDIRLMDESGRPRVTLFAHDSSSSIQVRDEKQQVRAEAWTDEALGGKMAIFSDTGKRLWCVPTDEMAVPK